MSYDNTAEVQEQEQEDNVVPMEPKKRVRKPKLDADGVPVEKKVRAPKEPKAPKLWPVWNEDGTQATDAEGNLLTSTERTKKPKVAKSATPRKTAVVYLLNGTATLVKDLMEAPITIVGDIGSRDGSKRADRVKAFEGAATVADFFTAGGVAKDLNRLAVLGRVELHLDGSKVEVAKAE